MPGRLYCSCPFVSWLVCLQNCTYYNEWIFMKVDGGWVSVHNRSHYFLVRIRIKGWILDFFLTSFNIVTASLLNINNAWIQIRTNGFLGGWYILMSTSLFGSKQKSCSSRFKLLLFDWIVGWSRLDWIKWSCWVLKEVFTLLKAIVFSICIKSNCKIGMQFTEYLCNL